jgi:hypothetical protein
LLGPRPLSALLIAGLLSALSIGSLLIALLSVGGLLPPTVVLVVARVVRHYFIKGLTV